MDSWLTAQPSAEARVRVLCFHHAGGSAVAFAHWRSIAPAGLELLPVQLPGRASRMRERAVTSMAELVDELARALAPILYDSTAGPPVAAFGHSAGATIAHAFACHLQSLARADNRWRPLCALVVSGRRARATLSPALREASDAELTAFLERMGGTPPELLADREFLATVVLPPLRADFALVDSWAWPPPRADSGATRAHAGPAAAEPDAKPAGQAVADSDAIATMRLVATPVHVVLGSHDPGTATLVADDAALADDWGETTSGPVARHVLEGGHFAVYERPKLGALLGWLAAALVDL